MSDNPDKEGSYHLRDILEEAMPRITFDQRNTAYHYYLYEHDILCPPKAYISGIDVYDPDLERFDDHKVRKTGEHIEEDGTHVQSVDIITNYNWVEDSETGANKKIIGDFQFEDGWEQEKRDYQRRFDIKCSPEGREKLISWIGGWYDSRKQDLKDLRNRKGGIFKQIKRHEENIKKLLVAKDRCSDLERMGEIRRMREAQEKLIDQLKGRLPSIEKEVAEVSKRLGIE
ncbi:hypothetical protein OAF65_11510 [Verrucomicrobiales bacterium]|nr:hypothetical protein [Verrucomicrobiales bacterium]